MDYFIRSSGINLYILLIAILVIILFSAAFIILAAFFFHEKKRSLEYGLDDELIRESASKYIYKRLKKNKSTSFVDIDKEIKANKRTNRIISIVSDGLIALLFVYFTIMIGVSLSIKASGDQMWLGDKAVLVIQTDSMERAYKGNTYLLDENGKPNEADRIPQFAYISISNKEEYINNIKPFDVVAFKMQKDSNGGNYVTIVHRLIYVEYDENNEPLYTFRGDANSSSLTGEIKVKKDLIVGVHQSEHFHGEKNLAFGYFISYMQSNIGIIIVFVAFVMMGLYSFLLDRLNKPYNHRFMLILEKDIEAICIEQKEVIAQEEDGKEK